MPAEARDEIPALYARLQEEVRRSDVTTERPLVRRPGLKGALVYAVKKLRRPEGRAAHEQRVVVNRPARRGRGRRVAYYSPMPPERSGIADYSALLLPALERLVDVDVAPRGKRADGDIALYHVGNDPEVHGWIVERLRREPGIVVLHDFVLHHLVASLTLGRKDEVLERATGVIVHSRYVEERVRERGYDRPLWRIPHPAWPPPQVVTDRPSGEPVFGAFGNVNASKRVPQLLEAFARFRDLHPSARLLLVGAAAAGSEQHGKADGVVREGYVDEERLWALIAGVDAVISLRSPTMGETSGTAIRALTLGKPLLVSDVGWFSELPDDVALKVAPRDGEVERLVVALEKLRDPAVRERMGANARDLAGEHDVGHVAYLYASALQEAAGAVRALSEVQR